MCNYNVTMKSSLSGNAKVWKHLNDPVFILIVPYQILRPPCRNLLGKLFEIIITQKWCFGVWKYLILSWAKPDKFNLIEITRWVPMCTTEHSVVTWVTVTFRAPCNVFSQYLGKHWPFNKLPAGIWKMFCHSGFSNKSYQHLLNIQKLLPRRQQAEQRTACLNFVFYTIHISLNFV